MLIQVLFLYLVYSFGVWDTVYIIKEGPKYKGHKKNVGDFQSFERNNVHITVCVKIS